ENTAVMPANTVFKMATENAAKALGFRGGRISKEMKADIIVLKSLFPTPVTPENVIMQIVVYASGSWVETVLVDGKIVVKDGETTKINAEKSRKGCIRAAEKFWGGV
ncbi:MAG: amidohydrolase family protein, partial [Candidatus Caldarchaeum sp.]